MKTITEKFIDGKLVERVTVEDAHQESQSVPSVIDTSPWWSIYPRCPNTGGTITTTNVKNITLTA